MGVSVGAGDYGLGVVATLIILLSLWPMRKLATAVGIRAKRSHRLELELEPQASIADVLTRLEAQGAQTASAKVTEEDEVRRLELVVQQTDSDLARLLEAASSAPDVRSAMIAS